MEEEEEQKPIFPAKLIVAAVVIGAVLTISIATGSAIYQRFFKTQAPTISFDDLPHGIGETPVKFVVRCANEVSGLSKISVTARQGDAAVLLTEVELPVDTKEKALHLNFSGKKSGLIEGAVEIEVKAIDRSAFGRTSVKSLTMNVDFKRPRLIVITSPRSIIRGGTGLVFYRAFDDDLSSHGVRVGSRLFPGFPASGLDPDLTEPSLFAAFFTVEDVLAADKTGIKILAEDFVGNSAIAPYEARIFKRNNRVVEIAVSPEYISNYIEPKVRDLNAHSGAKNEELNVEQMFQRFFVDGGQLAAAQLNKELSNTRFQALWENEFEPLKGRIGLFFGDKMKFLLPGKKELSNFSSFIQIITPEDDPSVQVRAEGIIAFAGELGVLGTTVVVDHGLGIASVFYDLSAISVSKGEKVARNGVVGKAGRNWFGPGRSYRTEMRVSGTAVDPADWASKDWFRQTVESQLNEVKRTLGMTVYQRVE